MIFFSAVEARIHKWKNVQRLCVCIPWIIPNYFELFETVELSTRDVFPGSTSVSILNKQCLKFFVLKPYRRFETFFVAFNRSLSIKILLLQLQIDFK